MQSQDRALHYSASRDKKSENLLSMRALMHWLIGCALVYYV